MYSACSAPPQSTPTISTIGRLVNDLTTTGSFLRRRSDAPIKQREQNVSERFLKVNTGCGKQLSESVQVLQSENLERRDGAADFIEKCAGPVLIAPTVDVGPIDLIPLHGE